MNRLKRTPPFDVEWNATGPAPNALANRIGISTGLAAVLCAAAFAGITGRSSASGDQIIFDNTHLPHRGELFFPDGDADNIVAQPIKLGDNNTLSRVEIAMGRQGALVDGTLHFSVWDADEHGLPGQQVGQLGTIDVMSLTDFAEDFPPHALDAIVFETPVTGLNPFATYFVRGDWDITGGRGFQSIFNAFLSRSEGTNGAGVLLVRDGDELVPMDNFGFGERYLQMSVTASKTAPSTRSINFSQDRLIFTEPENVLSVSSPRFENFPHVSHDGLRIYFSSDSPSSNGELPELYMAERSSLDEPFGARVKLGGNQGHVNFLGSVSADEQTIYYGSFAPPSGKQAVYRATRDSLAQSFDFASAQPISAINDLGFDVQLGHVSSDGLRIHFNASDGDVLQPYVATRADTSQSFGNAQPVLGAGYLVEQETSDSLALLAWSRDTDETAQADLFMATRRSTDENFDSWKSLGPILNSAADETFPFLHEATATLYFTSDRPGTTTPQEGPPCCAPVRDIWQSHVSFAGDYDFDQQLTVEDIDLLAEVIRSGVHQYNFDNDLNGLVDQADLTLWVTGANFADTYVGDANLDGEFSNLDIVDVLRSGKFETPQAASWQEGDWDANGFFDRNDIVLALQGGGFGRGPRAEGSEGRGEQRAGPFEALMSGGRRQDGQTSLVYDAGTGELLIDAPAGTELTSVNIDSASGIFTGEASQNLGGSFDHDADTNIFKATFGGSFGSLSFGQVAVAGLAKEFVLADLSVVGSLAGGGDLGSVDLVYVPEPASAWLLACGLPLALLAKK